MPRHGERHRGGRVGALRAGVLGADDGIVSTASLMIGVSASGAGRDAILVAGLAGLVAGAMSMAAGEYVSVSAQRDSELADIAREEAEQLASPASELDELAHIYEERGLEPALARTVAIELTAHDPLGAHLRDELGLDRSDAGATAPGRRGLGGRVHGRCDRAGAHAARRARLGARLVDRRRRPRLPRGRRCGRRAGRRLATGARRAARVALGGGAAMAATAVIGRLLDVAGV